METVERFEEEVKEKFTINSFIEDGAKEFDPLINNLFVKIAEQFPILLHINIAKLSTEDEPNTAGMFRLEVKNNEVLPTILIIPGNLEHLESLFVFRKSSVESVARRLGVDYDKMTPETLGLYIIAHELGHAMDYVKNYESNPELQGEELTDEWEVNSFSCLLMLPIRGLSPAELRSILNNYTTLEDYFIGEEISEKEQKEVLKRGVSNIEGLLELQAKAYRESSFEAYADDFATRMLLENAEELGLSEISMVGQVAA